ncbi:hypothetical protein JB92DRAFT_2825667 [Gautieria morchelliformis]|nr:hypothetical protein JB92DRAFT_2825667 [Gautieria morchelliformis]
MADFFLNTACHIFVFLLLSAVSQRRRLMYEQKYPARTFFLDADGGKMQASILYMPMDTESNGVVLAQGRVAARPSAAVATDTRNAVARGDPALCRTDGTPSHHQPTHSLKYFHASHDCLSGSKAIHASPVCAVHTSA